MNKEKLKETPLKKYPVQLDAEQRTLLESMITGGKASARSQMHARILLKADKGTQGPGWTDQQIAEALEVGTATVGRVRQRFVQDGILEESVGRPRPGRPQQKQ